MAPLMMYTYRLREILATITARYDYSDGFPKARRN